MATFFQDRRHTPLRIGGASIGVGVLREDFVESRQAVLAARGWISYALLTVGVF